MRKGRRKLLIRILERVGLALLLLDAVLYFALVRPLGNLVAAEQRRYTVTRDRVREQQARVARLEKFQAALPGTDAQIKLFLRNHVPPRREGFSRAARLMRRVTEQSGLELTGIAYRLDAGGDEPLRRLEVEVHVEGSFASLLKFAHALETAGDMIVIRDFTFEPSEGGRVALRLAANLYLLP